MIIGITGLYCSGKDTVAEYLVKKYNFIHYSLSDVLREELTLKKIDITRQNLLKTGNELREKNGYSILAERILKNCEEDKNYIITSIRHPAEIEAMKKMKNFHLVYIQALPEARFERMRKRNRHGDPWSYEEFLFLEGKEASSPGAGQQIKKCEELSEFILVNDGDIEDLNEKIDEMIQVLNLENY